MLAVIQRVLSHVPEHRGTSPAVALEYLARRSVVFEADVYGAQVVERGRITAASPDGTTTIEIDGHTAVVKGQARLSGRTTKVGRLSTSLPRP